MNKIRYWIFDYKFKLVARFITKHKLWWNSEDAKRWKRFV